MRTGASTWIPPVLLAALLAALLGVGCGWKLETRDGPAKAEAAPQEAPAFTLQSDDGTMVSLDELLAGGRPAVLVFYRGHW